MRSLVMILIVAATLASVVFCISYGVRSPWYSSLVGRMQFTKSLCLCVALLNSCINVVFRSYPGQMIVITIIAAALAGALWFQVYVLLRIQSGKLDSNRHYGKPVPHNRRKDDVKELKGN